MAGYLAGAPAPTQLSRPQRPRPSGSVGRTQRRVQCAASLKLQSFEERPRVVRARAVQADPVKSPAAAPKVSAPRLTIRGVHHVALICENLEWSMDFYCGLLGLEINPDRPDSKLPYRGAWLWIGTEMIHLMELPNPDPLVGRPEHGGRDRHFCIGLDDLDVLVSALEAAGVPYTRSKSGRAAVFFRDPDSNTIEAVETDWGTWRREGPSAEDRE